MPYVAWQRGRCLVIVCENGSRSLEVDVDVDVYVRGRVGPLTVHCTSL